MRWHGVASAFFLALLLVGCDRVSSENIVRWKGTHKGPGKLESALRKDGVAPKLRAQAAVALVEIGEAERVDEVLAELGRGEVAAVGAAIVPLYGDILAGADVEAKRTARDRLFLWRTRAEAALKQDIDGVLLPATLAAIKEGRGTGGQYSPSTVLGAIGVPAFAGLVAILEDVRLPFITAAEVLAEIGDAQAKQAGGQALVKRAQAGGEIPVMLWKALGQMGGAATTAFLVDRIRRGDPSQAVAAVQALQQGEKRTDLVPLALELAGDRRTHPAVRDELFGLLEHAGGEGAVSGAIGIIATDPDALVRYRAYETAVAAGGAAALGRALEGFPADASFKREDVVDFLVKDVLKLEADAARSAALGLLDSASPLAKTVGILSLEELGSAAQAEAVWALANDPGLVRGLPRSSSVASEAKRVSAILRGRKAPPGPK